MKIVFLLQASSAVIRGGSEIQAEFIMEEALKSGHDAVMISDAGRGAVNGGDSFHIQLKHRSRIYAFMNFAALLKQLRRLNPDLIYQRWRIPYTGVAAWYCRRRKTRLVFNAAGRSDVQKNRVRLNVFFPFRLMNEILGRYGIRHADQLVAQTSEQARLFEQRFGRESVVIPNGHPVPEPPFTKASPPEVVWVANVKPVKRLELFLNLAHELRGTDARFLCIGRPADGPYRETVGHSFRRVANVEFLGELSLQETNERIARASVLVNTSRHEGFPNTFIQAWLRETPVVSMGVDPDDILTRHEIGFKSGDLEGMARDLRFLLDNPAVRAAMGRKARKYAAAHHDIRAIGRKYIELFTEIFPSPGEPDRKSSC